jgi:hypothetical protein
MHSKFICLSLFAVTLSANAQTLDSALPDLALQPPRVTAEFDKDTVKTTRGAQGVPSIERATNGRLWTA